MLHQSERRQRKIGLRGHGHAAQTEGDVEPHLGAEGGQDVQLRSPIGAQGSVVENEVEQPNLASNQRIDTLREDVEINAAPGRQEPNRNVEIHGDHRSKRGEDRHQEADVERQQSVIPEGRVEKPRVGVDVEAGEREGIEVHIHRRPQGSPAEAVLSCQRLVRR